MNRKITLGILYLLIAIYLATATTGVVVAGAVGYRVTLIVSVASLLLGIYYMATGAND